jgi:MEDS: MEthanogen/methylotroph, DcmR Sensory domain
LDKYLEKGQIEIISHKDWFLKEGTFNQDRASNCCAERISHILPNGYDGVRLSGNNSWLEKENWDSFITFKEQMDIAIRNI